jgi:hypothetical protein
MTQLKLLSFMNVPAEIRLRNIKNVDFNDESGIITNWIEKTNVDDNESKKITIKTYNSIRNKEIKKIVKHLFEQWSDAMNLYTHNCQHFSYYVTQLYNPL